MVLLLPDAFYLLTFFNLSIQYNKRNENSQRRKIFFPPLDIFLFEEYIMLHQDYKLTDYENEYTVKIR